MYALSGVSSKDGLCVMAVSPFVIAEVIEADQTLNSEFCALDKDAEIRQARHNAIQFLSEIFAEHL
jgi:hypothetical protein